ncbi:MAG: TonB-dependent receptor, partial [Gemmatimonadota bacterium]
MSRIAGAVLLTTLLVGRASAQARVEGIVVDSATAAPLPAARVMVGARTVLSDRFGRFVLTDLSFPVELLVARIGARTERVVIDAPPAGILRIALVPRAIQLADLVVAGEGDPSLVGIGRWSIPVGEGVVPPVGVPDLLRELSAAPAVTQSTLFSARPLIRGYDAGEATLLLDGFDLPNPYHLGRTFSSLPPEAVEQVSIATAPLDPSIGGSSGAAVDILGRTGPATDRTGGLYLSPVSLAGWMGGSLGGTRLFGAARSLTIGSAAAVAGKKFPYGFRDLYLSALPTHGGTPVARATLFASHDRIADADGGDAMAWGVFLAGVRFDAWRRENDKLEVTAHATHFGEEIDGLEFDGQVIDVDNDLARAGLGLEWSHAVGDQRLSLGVDPEWSRIKNQVTITSGTLTPADEDVDRVALGVYGSWGARLGKLRTNLGLRYDAAGGVGEWQPRLRAELPLGPKWILGAAVGRSARLVHQVADPRPTGDLVLYDLWKIAGADGIPPARIDHAQLSMGYRRGAFLLQGALFASRGGGMLEVTPPAARTIGGTTFRIGDARTAGLELQSGFEGRRRSLTLSYVWSRSERDWGDGWIPWAQDRHHLVRLMEQERLGRSWRASILVEGLSAAPLTPVDHIVRPGTPTGDGSTGFELPVYVYGIENSARGKATFRVDLGLEKEFHGPWGSAGTVNLSLTNLTFGPVTPIRPEDPA